MGLIRLLLALSVVISHSNTIFGIELVGGPIAVQSFFIISGFYMALVLNEKYFDQGLSNKKSYKLFISNRFLKLFPSYWVVLLLTAIVSFAFMYASDGKEVGKLDHWVQYKDKLNIGSWVYLAFTNLFMFLQDMVLFLGLDPNSGSLYFTRNFENSNPVVVNFMLVPQTWSIGIELIFYLIAPLILRKGLKLILPLLLLSLLARAVMFGNGFDFDPWTYRFFPLELLFFLMGAMAYHVYKKLKLGRYAFQLKGLAFLFLIGSIVMYPFIKLDYKCIPFFIIFFLLLPYVFEFSKKSKIDRFIGDLSYPVYISHLFILMLIIHFGISSFYHLGLYLALFSILFSVLLHFLVLYPIDRYRQKRLQK